MKTDHSAPAETDAYSPESVDEYIAHASHAAIREGNNDIHKTQL